MEKPYRIAHRGDSTTAPENTIEAIQAAADFGCEGIEIDVRLTKDNKIVLMHDEYIDRMVFNGKETKLNLRLRDLNWNEVIKYKIPYENHLLPDFPKAGIKKEKLLFDRVDNRMFGKDPKFPYKHTDNYTSPLLLEDLILWLQKNYSKIILEVECKDSGMAQYLEKLINITKSHNLVILMSGDTKIIDEFQEYFIKNNQLQNFKLGANIRRLNIHWKNKLEYMIFFEVGLNPNYLSKKDVDYLHNKNILVFSNLGDYPEWWEKIHDFGIDGFKTNYIREYTEWWNKNIT